MKIRIVEPGWAGYSDWFGGVQFVDGVSVDDVSTADARALAGLVAIETVPLEGQEPVNPSIAQVIIDTRPLVAQVAAPAPAQEALLCDRVFTQEELSAIADTNGIKGLRAIADPRGIKGTSITDLIAKILANQKPAVPVAEVSNDGQSDVEQGSSDAGDAGEQPAV